MQCVWPEAVCVQAVCVLCNVYKSPGVPQGAWDRAVTDQDSNVTITGALKRSVSWEKFRAE